MRMKGLSGADFVLTSKDGEVVAASRQSEFFDNLWQRASVDATREITLGTPTQIGDARFYYAGLRLSGRGGPNQHCVLHILLPEQSRTDAMRQAVMPPLIVGGIALLFL